MSFEAKLVALLDAASLSCGDRIFPILLPEGEALPAVSYMMIRPSEARGRSRDGGQPDLERLRIQVNVWGQTFEQARSLAEQIRAILEGHKDDTPVERIAWSFIANVDDEYEEGANLFIRRLDCIAWYVRS